MAIKTWTGTAYRDIADLGAGNKPVTAAWVWNGSWNKVWSAHVWTDVDGVMSNEIVIDRNTWTDIVFDTLTGATYAGGIVMEGSGTADVTVTVSHQKNGAIVAQKDVRLLVNNVVVGEGTTAQGEDETVFAFWFIDLAAGDIVKFQVFTSNNNNLPRTIYGGTSISMELSPG